MKAPKAISTFIRDNAWQVLLEDGTDRPARDGEVGKLKVSGYTTNILRRAIVERAELILVAKAAREFISKEYKALPPQAFDRPDWNRIMAGINAALAKVAVRP